MAIELLELLSASLLSLNAATASRVEASRGTFPQDALSSLHGGSRHRFEKGRCLSDSPQPKSRRLGVGLARCRAADCGTSSAPQAFDRRHLDGLGLNPAPCTGAGKHRE
jgi:hypothetical protein